MADATPPDPAHDPEALTGAERSVRLYADQRDQWLDRDDVARLMAEYERLKRVEASARALMERWDGVTIRQEFAVTREQLDALARELARPAGEDGGGSGDN